MRFIPLRVLRPKRRDFKRRSCFSGSASGYGLLQAAHFLEVVKIAQLAFKAAVRLWGYAILATNVLFSFFP